ncbi:unnamed protein product [Calypogeia fissa]
MEGEFYITSTAFSEGGHIPRKYTADGAGAQVDFSPPLEWHNVPEDTETLAIIVEDIDAPDPEDPVVPFVHWVVVNIPPTLKGLPADFKLKDFEGQPEYEGIQEGVNDFKVPGYRGPSPPKGVHRIEYRVYTLDTRVNLGHKVTAPKFLDEYSGNIIAQATLTGVYSKEKTGKGGFIPVRLPLGGNTHNSTVHQ